MDEVGRYLPHYPTCGRCGNSGPGVWIWSKKLQRKKVVCAWCLDEFRAKLRRRRGSDSIAP